MAECRLRVFHGPAETMALPPAAGADTVTVTLGEILPLLADAVRSQRTWLADFDSDEVTISTDLYEVILAYRHYRRPSA